jgi:DNA-binding ferritin-like protein
LSSKTPKSVSDWLAFDDTRTAYMAASPKQKAEVVRYLGGVLALLRAQALSYQTSHWQVRGDDYYGNHLMFERLYGSVGEEIDTLAEKIVGYVGVEGVALPDQMEKIHMLCGAWGRIECHHRRGIQSETDLQKALKIAYDSIKESGLMTLGLDDFLMATASSHESNQYLLQQALAARPKSAASPRKSSIRRKAAVPKKYEHIDFKPPKGVADAAAKGLELRQKASPSNRGGLTSEEAGKQGIGSGVQRAVNLKNRDTVSPKVIKQMHGFLSRAEGYSEIADDNKSTPWNDKGYVAWLLWGGDPAKSWVDKIIGQMEAADEKEKAKKAHLIVTASENEPTNPDLWAKVQALAKGEQASMTHGGKTINGPNDGKGFTVFPSAYANGWASKVYKDLGGGWKKKAGGA